MRRPLNKIKTQIILNHISTPMKRIITVILTILISVFSFGQEHFNSSEELIGQEVIFFELDKLFDSFGPFAYLENGRKYSPVENRFDYEYISGIPATVETITEWKRNRYLKVITKLNTYYFILDNRIDYRNKCRSLTYIHECLIDYRAKYKYLSKDCPALSDKGLKNPEPGGYYPIRWISYKEPKTLYDKATFNCTVGDKSVSVTEDYITCKDKYFITETEYAEIKVKAEQEAKEQAKLDSLADANSVCPAILMHDNTTTSRALQEALSIDYNNVKDTLLLYVYQSIEPSKVFKKKKYIGICLGKKVEIWQDGLTFLDLKAKDYVDSRGDEGISLRKVNAVEKEKEQLKHYEQQAELINKYRKENKIFINDWGYSYGDYKFGIKVNLFNCFSKTIKYVDINVVAYNAVGDRQKDAVGNSSVNAHCIGPLEPKTDGQWEYNNLFYNENKLIKKLVITDVKFTFMDNTTISYSGASKIEQHMYETHIDNILKNLDP